MTAALSHHCMEPRSCMAYWQNGKCFVHGSTQSQTSVLPSLASIAGVEPDALVYIAEYCGGGFGSKIGAYPVMGVPIHLAKKTGMPVMLRVNRAEEALFGSSRPAFQGRIKIGFRADGRITAVDLFLVQQNGPYTGGGDLGGAARRRLVVVSATGDALPRRCREHEHDTHRRPTRPGSEPNRGGARAAAR